MNKVVRLTESDLIRLVKRVIKEEEMNREDITQSEDFLKLVDILNSNPEAADELRQELSGTITEDEDQEYHYYDYGDERPVPITRKEYWIRRLRTLGLSAAVGALLGTMMTGGLSAPDVLEMALGGAAGLGAVGDVLVRTVGRKKGKEENAVEPKQKLGESDLIKMIKKVLTEQNKSSDFISELVIKEPSRGIYTGSYVRIPDEEDPIKSHPPFSNEFPDLIVRSSCKQGTYTSIPKGCSIIIKYSANEEYLCDSETCRRLDIER